MAKIRIVGDSSGYVELAAPNAAGNNTLELPSNATKLVGADASNSLNVTGIATFSGGIVVSAGTTAAPSISPTGDSNTGIFFPSADTVAIGEGGVEALRVNSSGYVGINSTSPRSYLDVGGAIYAGRIDSSSEGGEISLCRSSDNVPAWSVDVNGNTSTPSLRFVDNTAGAARIQIDGSGRVTKPYQPAFFASSSASSVSTGGIVAYNSVAYNIGSHYDGTTNYRFTAPVSGIYHIGFMLRANNSNTVSGYGQLMLNVNGSSSTSGRYLAQSIYGTGVLNSQYASMCANTQLSLSAGDYVDIRNTNTAINFSGNESYFYGILLG